MATPYKERVRLIDQVCQRIEKGESARQAILNTKGISRTTFHEWLNQDETFSGQYARATKIRESVLFDEIIEIADDDSKKSDQRSRLMVDARKWVLSKMNPKKYGDKMDMTTDGDKIQNNPLVLADGRTIDDVVNELKPE